MSYTALDQQWKGPMHPADDYDLFWDLHEVRVSYRIHYANYRDLKGYLSAFASMDHWSPGNRGQLFDSLLEVQRCLQNSLSSASALVAHTERHLKRFYRRTKFGAGFLSELEALQSSAIHQFVDELRNYNLHEAISNVWANLSASPSGPQGKVTLLVSDLLKSKRWHVGARAYLEQAGDDLDIARTVDDHMALLRDFHAQLRQEELGIHSDLLKRLGREIENLPEESLEREPR